MRSPPRRRLVQERQPRSTRPAPLHTASERRSAPAETNDHRRDNAGGRALRKMSVRIALLHCRHFHDFHLENERDAHRNRCAGVRNADADCTRPRPLFLSITVPPDGTTATSTESGDLGTSPFFGQLSDRCYLPNNNHMGCRSLKRNGGSTNQSIMLRFTQTRSARPPSCASGGHVKVDFAAPWNTAQEAAI
jgi:hypothetical protein